MTAYRLFPATNGPASSTADTTQYVMGVSFKVTSPGLYFAGWWWWVADASQDAAARNLALYTVTGGHAGTLVAGSVTMSGAYALGWNYTPIAAPAALTQNQEYRAVTAVISTGGLNGYSSTSNYYGSGAGANGITNGPLLAYAGAGGASNKEPADDAQMVFNATGADVTADYPSTEFNSANYWLDVQVTTVAPGGHKDRSGSPLAALLTAA